MDVRTSTDRPEDTGADAIAVGVPEGRKVTHVHEDGMPRILVRVGAVGELDAERARGAAARALGRARELGAESLCWELPDGAEDAVAAGLVEGTLLAAYRYEKHKSSPSTERAPGSLILSAPRDLAAVAERAALLAEAQNAARDLQNAPANELTPSALADRARELAGEVEGLSVEVEGREGLAARGMGAFAAVAQGSAQEPALIVLRHEPPAAAPGAPLLGFVGKAVTFDSGGISIKPAGTMHEMKFDMSGGAAVIEAIGAIARLRLPVRVLGVVGAAENLPGGRAVKPGDIVRSKAGITIEINNTDAEGRLVLSDCIAYARELGAERLVDLATLTGAIVTALGSTYSGLFSNDDAWAEAVRAAGEAAGERVWRMPLDPEYSDMLDGRYADIVNSTVPRGKAAAITAAEFLHRFAQDTPWAHLDIAGTAWDAGRPYAAKGGSGVGVRLLVELATALSAG